MRSITKVQGLIGTGVQWSKKAEVAEWGAFAITSSRLAQTKFGEAYEFTLVHVENGDMKVILMAPTNVRKQLLDYFADSEAEPLGPCKLQMGEKAWMFLEVQEDTEQLALENAQF